MESDKEREEDGCSLIPCPGVFGHHHHPSSFIICCRPPFLRISLKLHRSTKKHGGKVRNRRERVRSAFLLLLRNNQNERERVLDASRVTHRVRDEGVGLLLVMAYCNTLVQWICVRLEIPVGLGCGSKADRANDIIFAHQVARDVKVDGARLRYTAWLSCAACQWRPMMGCWL